MSTAPRPALTRSDLLSLENYASERAAFRARAIAHKRQRSFALGEHMTLLFEDRLTVQYQVQEMLRIERIFEPQAIQEELDAYNPLISDADNLKATLLIEFTDPVERTRMLAQWRGIEHRVFLQASADEKCFASADEDLDRSNESKTSAVHFLRFPIDAGIHAAIAAGAALSFGIDDARYPQSLQIPSERARALLAPPAA
ncbi:MAG: DUF3501 family protein [Lysobacterales bacterium]